MSIRIFGAAALLATLARASNVNVLNNCNFEVKAIPSSEGADHSDQYLKPGDTFTRPASGAAWCLKLFGPGINGQQWASKPTQLEWSTWEPSPGHSLLSYDLSDIDMGDDTTFLQHGMNLTSEDPTCDHPSSTCRPAICKAQGVGSTSACQDAYNQPFDTRTLGASASYNINMVLCTANEELSSSPNSGNANSAPAPSSSDASNSAPAAYAAPQPQTTLATSAAAAPASYITDAPTVQEESNPNVVTQWVENTEVITQIITARNTEPTLHRRHAHPHGHAHHHGA